MKRALLDLMFTLAVHAQNCAVTSVGRTPVSDLGAGLYLGQYQGGLYPGGQNTMPAGHFAAGLVQAAGVVPRNAAGAPSPSGKYVLLSIGMSNTTQEFCSQGGTPPCDAVTFMARAAASPLVNHTTLVIANGAAGGQAAATWDSPIDPNYNRVRDTVLAPQGLTEAQVQAAWIKVANPQPSVSLPAANSDAFTLVTQMGNIVRAVRTRYPNIQVVFLSSRIYAGYATTALNPEPYAYESGFAVKWLIEAQINQMNGGGIDPRAGDLNSNTVAPWIAWGPYLWADGLVPRSDGLTWLCSDFSSDGTHPAMPGRGKVGQMLLDFFLASPHAAWFRAGSECYANCDGSVGNPLLTANDFQCFFNRYAAGLPYANCDGAGGLTPNDFACFLNRYAAGCS
jgi:hypothetical protein